jgi:hypothetical protein
MRNRSIQAFVAVATLTVAGATLLASSAIAAMPAMLSGAQEVPATDSKATGSSSIVVNADRTVTGAVDTTGIDGTMAHIHLAAKGANGPPVITLEKAGANRWAVPAKATLTPEQYQAYKDGNLYVNVHSAAHMGGEIRLQLAP